MIYLPRICEHCLNPSCVASCPSGAMYKREEDGIVLVDQDACRGWRMCVSGCPYKKVYFNWQTRQGREVHALLPAASRPGMPTICSETCVGRIRYLGVVLYDADRVEEAASVPDEKDLLDAQLDALPRPARPRGARAGARATGSPRTGSRPRGARPSTRSRRALADRAAAASRVPHAADGLVRAAALAGDEHGRGRRLARPTPTTSSRRSTSCGSRSSTWRTCSPPATRSPCGVALRRLAAMRRYMREQNARRRARRRDRRRRSGMTPDADRGDVPAARDRQVRRALRDPAGARRGRGLAGAGRVRLAAPSPPSPGG